MREAYNWWKGLTYNNKSWWAQSIGKPVSNISLNDIERIYNSLEYK